MLKITYSLRGVVARGRCKPARPPFPAPWHPRRVRRRPLPATIRHRGGGQAVLCGKNTLVKIEQRSDHGFEQALNTACISVFGSIPRRWRAW